MPHSDVTSIQIESKDELEMSSSERETRGRRVLKSGRVSPLDITSQSTEKERDGLEVYRLIFIAALVVGIPLFPSQLATGGNGRCLAITWCATSTTLKTALFVLNNAYNYLLWTSPSVRWSIFIHDVCGFSVMLYLILVRQDIVLLIKEMRDLFLRLDSDMLSQPTEKYFKIIFFTIWLFMCSFISTLSYFVSSFSASFAANVRPLVPFPDDSPFFNFYNNLIMVASVFCYQMGTITLFIGLFICSNLHVSSSRLLPAYFLKLRKDIEGKPFTKRVSSENTALFQAIVQCIQKMDDTCNVMAFIIYMAVINSVFDFMGVALSSDTRFFSFLVGSLNTMVITSVSAMFFYLTWSGNRLSEEWDNLNRNLLELSGFVLNEARDTSTLHEYELFSRNIKTTKLHATGFDLFDIDRKLILPSFGLIISYSVMLNDIGANADG